MQTSDDATHFTWSPLITGKLQEYRFQFLRYCNPSSQFWLEWIRSDSIADTPQCKAWLSRLASHCPSFETVLAVLDALVELTDADAIVSEVLVYGPAGFA